MKIGEEMFIKLSQLTDDEMLQVTGGHGEKSMLDAIIEEITMWLDAHPNATKSDVYSLLNEKMAMYADELTEDELECLKQLLNSFAE